MKTNVGLNSLISLFIECYQGKLRSEKLNEKYNKNKLKTSTKASKLWFNGFDKRVI